MVHNFYKVIFNFRTIIPQIWIPLSQSWWTEWSKLKDPLFENWAQKQLSKVFYLMAFFLFFYNHGFDFFQRKIFLFWMEIRLIRIQRSQLLMQKIFLVLLKMLITQGNFRLLKAQKISKNRNKRCFIASIPKFQADPSIQHMSSTQGPHLLSTRNPSVQHMNSTQGPHLFSNRNLSAQHRKHFNSIHSF